MIRAIRFRTVSAMDGRGFLNLNQNSTGDTMQQINSLMALEIANQKLGQPSKLERKQESQLNASTLKMVALTFTRMTDLFSHKAINQGFLIYFDQEKNMYSDNFQLWCRKLADLEPVHFQAAMKNIEIMAEESFKNGEQMWPPSYAEFRALAFPKSDRDALAHKPFDRLPALEDQTAKAKRYEIGQREASKLLAMFPDEQTKPEASENTEFARARLELAKQRLSKVENNNLEAENGNGRPP